MESMAFTQEKSLFKHLDDVASYANLSESERLAYDSELKAYRDLVGQLSYAEARGREEGLAQGEARGVARGRKEGFAQGEARGVARGLKEGFAQGEARGVARGRKEGEARGRNEERVGLILEMARQGLGLDMIAAVTKLTVDKVESIIVSGGSYM